MAKYVIEDTTLTNTANAIREKTGKADTITPSNFATEIASIETGGGGSTVTKGIIINEFDSAGYAADVSVVGMTEIPGGYFFSSSTSGNPIFRFMVNVDLNKEITKFGPYSFYSCEKLKLPILHSGITYLSNSCFEYDVGLTEMTVEGMLTYIGTKCFNSCSNLKKFVLSNVTNVPNLYNKAAFNSTPIASGTGYIYVPDALVDSFKSATNWSTYADQIKGISELEASS